MAQSAFDLTGRLFLATIVALHSDLGTVVCFGFHSLNYRAFHTPTTKKRLHTLGVQKVKRPWTTHSSRASSPLVPSLLSSPRLWSTYEHLCTLHLHRSSIAARSPSARYPRFRPYRRRQHQPTNTSTAPELFTQRPSSYHENIPPAEFHPDPIVNKRHQQRPSSTPRSSGKTPFHQSRTRRETLIQQPERL